MWNYYDTCYIYSDCRWGVRVLFNVHKLLISGRRTMKNCSLKKKERKDGENAVDFPVVKKSKSEMKMANEKRVYTFM